MNRQIEILAPAGSYEGMKAAMNAGCDAVYIGGSSFGARAYANNLEADILLQAIDEAHIRDKKLYLTVNTLLKEKEHSEELYRYLEKYYLQGLDAVIVQDVGVLHFIHRQFPDLPIHASTQTTLTMAEGANLLKDYGVTRLVTARELSLEEIKNIRDNTDLEIETFVHGALCYCYSGQCLMSSIIGGRSGNRGRCAQPCRMPYQFYSDHKRLGTDQEKYLLSPKDINTVALIPDLVEAGIDSFKIEGRMKRPEYAAAVSSVYRKYVDLYFEIGKDKYNRFLQSDDFEKDMLQLQDVYSRGGFSEGYGRTYNGKKMMSMQRPNHSGVYVGDVVRMKEGQVTIALKEDVNAQDILEIFYKEEDGHEFTVKDPHSKGTQLITNTGKKQSRLRVGDLVYRTKNNALLNRLEEEYLLKDAKLGIQGYLYAKTGEPLALTVTYKDYTATATQGLVQEAQKQPMSKDKLSAPIEKTGETLYYFREISVDAGDNIFVPVAWLNEIRRDALRLLEEAVSGKYRRNHSVITKNKSSQEKLSQESLSQESLSQESLSQESLSQESLSQKSLSHGDLSYESHAPVSTKSNNRPGLVVTVQTKEQFYATLKYPEIDAVYVDYDTIERSDILRLASDAVVYDKQFYLSLPHICRGAQYQRLKKELIEIIEKEAVHGFIVKNFEEIALLQSLLAETKQQKTVILNYNMYTYNKEAKLFWREQGINRFTAPVELNYQELKQLEVADSDFLVYGYLPLMVSAQCLFESTEGCRKCKAAHADKASHTGHLTDRLGKKFYVQTNCNGCYNFIYNGQALSLLKQEEELRVLHPQNLRLDFSLESAEDTTNILSKFIEVFRYGRKPGAELSDYTTGHFKRGVE